MASDSTLMTLSWSGRTKISCETAFSLLIAENRPMRFLLVFLQRHIPHPCLTDFGRVQEGVARKKKNRSPL